MQQISLTLAAAQTKTYDIAGAYFEIIDSTGAINVNFVDRHGSRTKDGELLGVVSGTFLEGPYSRFEITDASGVANTVTVLFGFGRGGTRRQPGNVRVIDQGADKTSALTQFFTAGVMPATAAVFSIIGVQAGAKPCYIKRLAVAFGVAGRIRFYTATGIPTTTPASNPVNNKALGSAAAAAIRAQGTSLIDPPTVGELPGLSAYGVLPCAALILVEVPLTTPLKLPANTGLYAHGLTANTDLYIFADIEE